MLRTPIRRGWRGRVARLGASAGHPGGAAQPPAATMRAARGPAATPRVVRLIAPRAAPGPVALGASVSSRARRPTLGAATVCQQVGKQRVPREGARRCPATLLPGEGAGPGGGGEGRALALRRTAGKGQNSHGEGGVGGWVAVWADGWVGDRVAAFDGGGATGSRSVPALTEGDALAVGRSRRCRCVPSGEYALASAGAVTLTAGLRESCSSSTAWFAITLTTGLREPCSSSTAWFAQGSAGSGGEGDGEGLGDGGVSGRNSCARKGEGEGREGTVSAVAWHTTQPPVIPPDIGRCSSPVCRGCCGRPPARTGWRRSIVSSARTRARDARVTSCVVPASAAADVCRRSSRYRACAAVRARPPPCAGGAVRPTRRAYSGVPSVLAEKVSAR